MDETLQAPQVEAVPGASQGEQAVVEGDAHKASAQAAVAKTEENLSRVGYRPVVLATGEVQTPRDREVELAHRQDNGRPSQA
jgi:hypothetical protein